MEKDIQALKSAHKACSNHRFLLAKSEVCGCFHCLSVFTPDAVREYTDRGQTALCPECGIDSVIGEASGYDVRGAFMKQMQDYWFDDVL